MAPVEKPIFSDKRMASIVSSLDIMSVESFSQTLQKPTAESLIIMYTAFVQHLDLDIPNISDFYEFQQLNYPEMHRKMVLLSCIAKTMAYIFKNLNCSLDFVLSDLVSPNAQRTRVFVSFYLNFMLFARQNVDAVKQAQDTQDNIAMQLETMKKERDELKNRYMKEITEKGEREEKIKHFEKRMLEADAQLKMLEEEKSQKQSILAEVDAEIVDQQKRIEERHHTRDDKQVCIHTLDSQLVTSPDRVKGELVRLEDAYQKLIELVADKEEMLNDRKRIVEYLEVYLQNVEEVRLKADKSAMLFDNNKKKQAEHLKILSDKKDKIIAIEKSNLELCSLNNDIAKLHENNTLVKSTWDERHQQVVDTNNSYINEHSRLGDLLDATINGLQELAFEQSELEEDKNQLQSAKNEANEKAKRILISVQQMHQAIVTMFDQKTSKIKSSYNI